MYEKVFNNIKSIIFGGVLLVLLLWAGISNVRLVTTQRNLRRTEQRLNDIRAELSNAQNREQELTATVGNIREITTRTDQILSQSGDTIQGIREKIQILENYVYSVNKYLSASNNNNDHSSDSEK